MWCWWRSKPWDGGGAAAGGINSNAGWSSAGKGANKSGRSGETMRRGVGFMAWIAGAVAAKPVPAAPRVCRRGRYRPGNRAARARPWAPLIGDGLGAGAELLDERFRLGEHPLRAEEAPD